MIRRYLKDGGPNAAHNAAVGKMYDVEKELLPEELSTALKVLVRLQETGSIQHDTTADLPKTSMLHLPLGNHEPFSFSTIHVHPLRFIQSRILSDFHATEIDLTP